MRAFSLVKRCAGYYFCSPVTFACQNGTLWTQKPFEWGSGIQGKEVTGRGPGLGRGCRNDNGRRGARPKSWLWKEWGKCRWDVKAGRGRCVSQVSWPARPPWTSAPRLELFASFPPFILDWAPLSPRELVIVASGNLRSASKWFSGGGQV